MKNHLPVWLLLIAFISCKENKSDANYNAEGKPKDAVSFDHYGSYFTESNEKREQGYDWVKVSLTEKEEGTAHVQITSREDKKRPTCTYNSVAVIVNDSTLRVADTLAPFLLEVHKNGELTLKTENEEESDKLMFYCSGGGNLAGKYYRMDDTAASDFKKTLEWEYSPNPVTAIIRTNSENMVEVEFPGFENKQQNYVAEFRGEISGAEIGDLNGDSWPEIVIYTTDSGELPEGRVIGYSVLNGKSATMINWPQFSEEERKEYGYAGGDEFAIVETTLVRRFPRYNLNGSEKTQTGETTQLQYKLSPGEAMPVFTIDKVISY
ncbi:hypothetical protein [Robertkochia aurantiaca]|uniref:hypothetical protein n=1 Tax=Robertkochia aurantiaca TaxID=2873700 RepID=UPI001CCC442A|nr:hypothetical protein [Robertkochia sp. 3YJGBD-33]